MKRRISLLLLAALLTVLGFVPPLSARDLSHFLDTLVIDDVDFSDLPLPQSVDLIKAQAAKHDPQGKGINVAIKPAGDKRDSAPISLKLTKPTLRVALLEIAKRSGHELKVEPYAVLLFPTAGQKSKAEESYAKAEPIPGGIEFDLSHPFVRDKPLYLRPWKDVRALGFVPGNSVRLFGYVEIGDGNEPLLMDEQVPLQALTRASYEKLLALDRQRKEQASASPSGTPARPRDWPEGSRYYDELLTREGRLFTRLWMYFGKDNWFHIYADGQVTHVHGVDIPARILLDFDLVPMAVQYHALVANTRTPLHQWSAAEENTRLPYQELAKQPTLGKAFAYIRPGYIVFNMYWRFNEWSGAELPKEYLGKHFAVIREKDFTSIVPDDSRWWNTDSTPLAKDMCPSDWKRTEVLPNAVLLDPFDMAVPILANRNREMKRVWTSQTRNGLPLALVETSGGYFYGYLREVEPLDDSEINWTLATQEKNGKFRLVKKNTYQLDLGKKSLFTLLDTTRRNALKAPLATLDRSRISARHLSRLLDGGMPALLSELTIPQSDGIEMIPETDTAPPTASFSAERVVEKIIVYPETCNPAEYRFRISTQQREREVSISYKSGLATTSETSWKKKVLDEYVQLPPDLDGGIRLTDGEKIYELTPNRFGKLEVVEWEVEPSPLQKKNNPRL